MSGVLGSGNSKSLKLGSEAQCLPWTTVLCSLEASMRLGRAGKHGQTNGPSLRGQKIEEPAAKQTGHLSRGIILTGPGWRYLP